MRCGAGSLPRPKQQDKNAATGPAAPEGGRDRCATPLGRYRRSGAGFMGQGTCCMRPGTRPLARSEAHVCVVVGAGRCTPAYRVRSAWTQLHGDDPALCPPVAGAPDGCNLQDPVVQSNTGATTDVSRDQSHNPSPSRSSHSVPEMLSRCTPSAYASQPSMNDCELPPQSSG